MSEYGEPHSVSRLIGSPPGYVGFEDGGQLTEAVRRRPYSVVLFDEMEKAHPEVFNVLLQVLDDGRLTDSKGNVVNFKNTIIIFTSNIGASVPGEETKEQTMSILKSRFKPEFLNRIDEFVYFNRLSVDDMVRITTNELKKVAARLQQKGIKINTTDRAKRWIAELGHDPLYGARPLKRELQREVETPVAKKILSGEVKTGDTIVVDYSPSTVGIVVSLDNTTKTESKTVA
jgi:ATP-dependent Clp protease ATP-binding subunit ClpB